MSNDNPVREPWRPVRTRGQLVAYVATATVFLALIYFVAALQVDFRNEVKTNRHRECLNDNRSKDAIKGAFDAYTRALIGSGDPPADPAEQQQRDEAVERFKASVERELAPAITAQDCSKILELDKE